MGFLNDPITIFQGQCSGALGHSLKLAIVDGPGDPVEVTQSHVVLLSVASS